MGTTTAFTISHPLFQNVNNVQTTIRISSTTRRRPRSNATTTIRACAAPGTPQKRSKPREHLSIYRDNPLLTREGQMIEIQRATRARKKGDWQFASSILFATQEYANRTCIYLTESIYVRALELSETSPDCTPLELYNDLRGIMSESLAIPNVKTINAVLSSLKFKMKRCKYYDVSDVLDVVVDAFDGFMLKEKRILPDEYTWSLLFSMCVEGNNIKHLKYFEKLAFENYFIFNNQNGKDGFKQGLICSSLVCAHVKFGNIKEADEIIKKMNDFNYHTTERAYASMLGGLHRHKKHSRLVELFKQSISAKTNLKITGRYIFSAVIASCARSGDIETAKVALEEMEKKKIIHGISILESIFSLCIRVNECQLAELIIFEYGINDNEFIKQVRSNHIARLISCVAKNEKEQDKRDKIWDIFNRMRFVLSINVDSIVLNSTSDALIRIGYAEEAKGLIENDMLNKYQVEYTLGSYKSLIRAYGSLKDSNGVLKVVEMIKSRNGINAFDYTIWNAVLHAGYSCDGEKGKSIVNLARKSMAANNNKNKNNNNNGSNSNERNYTMTLKEMRNKGDVKGVKELHVESIREGNTLNDKAYATILSTLIERGHNKEAISIFSWLVIKNMTTTMIFNVLIYQFGKNNNGYIVSERIFKYMKMSIRRRTIPDEISYTSMIRTFCTVGKLNQAFKLLSEMQDIGIGMNDTHAWTIVIQACGKEGQWERGIDLWKQMRNRSNKTIPIPNIAVYNSALYVAGIYGQHWNTSKYIFECMKIDFNDNVDVVSLSAMGSVILKCRFDIADGCQDDLIVIKFVVDGLIDVVKTIERQQRMAGDVDIGKIESKIQRLQWIMRIKSVEC